MMMMMTMIELILIFFNLFITRGHTELFVLDQLDVFSPLLLPLCTHRIRTWPLRPPTPP